MKFFLLKLGYRPLSEIDHCAIGEQSLHIMQQIYVYVYMYVCKKVNSWNLNCN